MGRGQRAWFYQKHRFLDPDERFSKTIFGRKPPQYCWEFHERPSPGPLLKKEASPAVRGERILEMLWRLQVAWIIGLLAFQPYTRGEFQEKLWERFRSFSGTVLGVWLIWALLKSEPPSWGRQKGVTPICPNLFRFPRFLPICSDLRSLFSEIPRFVPIFSVFFRFAPFSSDLSDLFSEQIRTNQGNPFLPTPFANPRQEMTGFNSNFQTPQTHTWKTHTSEFFLFCLYDSKFFGRVPLLIVKELCLQPFLSGLKQEWVN